MQAEYNRRLSEILKSQDAAASGGIKVQGDGSHTFDPDKIEYKPDRQPIKVSPGVYTVPVGGNFPSSLPPGAVFAPAAFPLDRLKLDDAGNWANTKPPYDPNAWIPWPDMTTDKPAPATNCDHKWVDIGFQFERLVCSKCDAVKP